jgi:serine/threonine protein kinase
VHDGVPYMVMELLTGVDLAAYLQERGKIPLAEVAGLMLPVASAVHAAHEAGVVHRDLKPSNIFLSRSDGGISPVILDFGISKLIGDVDRDLTASEVLLGTVHYMSPEQTRGGLKASASSDQYALGVVLYECTTGAKPFAGATPYAVMHAIVSARPLPPSALEPSLPPAFDEVVLRAMHRDPKIRFGSVRELGAALLPWASDECRNRHAREFGTVPASKSRRSVATYRWRAAAAIGSVGLLCAIGVSARSRQHDERSTASRVSATPSPVETPATAGALGPVGTSAELPSPITDVASSAQLPESLTAASGARLERRHAPSAASQRGQHADAAPSVPAPVRSQTERGTNGAFIVE